MKRLKYQNGGDNLSAEAILSEILGRQKIGSGVQDTYLPSRPSPGSTEDDKRPYQRGLMQNSGKDLLSFLVESFTRVVNSGLCEGETRSRWVFHRLLGRTRGKNKTTAEMV